MNQSPVIRISGQKLGIHAFEFLIQRPFFEQFEHSMIQDGNVVVSVEMDRKEREFDIKFQIHGTVVQTCVRCLEDGPWPISIEDRMYFELHPIDAMIEDDDEIIRLPIDLLELDLSQPIYELISLALPMRFTCADAEKSCDPDMEKLIQGESNETIDADETIDPRWEALKKLK